MSVSSIFLLFVCTSYVLAFPQGERKESAGVPGRCTVGNYACPLQNKLTSFEDTQTLEGCRQRCRENDECKW